MTIRFGAGKQHRSASPCSSFFFLSTLLVSVAAAALPATSFAAAALAAAALAAAALAAAALALAAAALAQPAAAVTPPSPSPPPPSPSMPPSSPPPPTPRRRPPLALALAAVTRRRQPAASHLHDVGVLSFDEPRVGCMCTHHTTALLEESIAQSREWQ